MAIEQVAFLIVGIFNIIFGFLIKKFKLANFLTFYDPKKDRDNRAQVEKTKYLKTLTIESNCYILYLTDRTQKLKTIFNTGKEV